MKISMVRTAVLTLSLMLAGCATTNPQDPFEDYNRAVFKFNDGFDRVALKPAAQAYNTLPSFVRTGVSNFFGNLGDVWTAVNNFLQGKPADGANDAARVLVNSTLGFAGLLDVASAGGLPKHNEDFGQTLGVWGVDSGPYLVLPFLGASTLRDTAALPADSKGDLWSYKEPVRWRNTGFAVRIVDLRAAALDVSNLIEDAALDRYQFVRDAYMQRRQSKVYDGNPPTPAYDNDFDSSDLYEEPASEAAPAGSGTEDSAALGTMEKEQAK